jgi:hypothetical protein
MRDKHITAIIIAFGVCMLVAQTGIAQEVTDLVIGDRSTVDDLELPKRVQELAIGFLTYVIAPVAGFFTAFKGWQMIGNAERGAKGPGVLTFLCGIGMFALPVIITQVLNAIRG